MSGSGSSAEDDCDNQDVIVIIENLFDLGLEEVLQKIFLCLDPKSLKNCKSSCSQWGEFIERRIWKSKSARQQLHHKLNYGWKHETPVRQVQRKSSSLIFNRYLSFSELLTRSCLPVSTTSSVTLRLSCVALIVERSWYSRLTQWTRSM